MTSTVKVHEILPKIFASILPEKIIVDHLTKFISYPSIESMKDIDLKSLPLPTYEKLDIDTVLDRILEIYCNKFEILKSKYICIFKPLETLGCIDVSDFMLLLNFIHVKFDNANSIY
jgi:hypothetical protein